MLGIVYFSNVSENTKRFVDKLGVPALRIPIYKNEEPLEVNSPYVLVTPTYGNGGNDAGVPKQVIKFLNLKKNRDLIKGVVAAGNTNFGDKYCYAGKVIAEKCSVPLVHKFELLGTTNDVETVKEKMEEMWKQY